MGMNKELLTNYVAALGGKSVGSDYNEDELNKLANNYVLKTLKIEHNEKV
jgi:hypothetical protein